MGNCGFYETFCMRQCECSAVQCSVGQSSTLQFTAGHSAVQGRAVHSVQCSSLQSTNLVVGPRRIFQPIPGSGLQYSTVHYITLKYVTVHYSTLQYSTAQLSTVSNQSLQRVSSMPQSTLDKSSRQYNLFGYHT